MQITEEQEARIIAVQKMVRKLQKKQDEEFAALVSELDMAAQPINDFLFDFVFNSELNTEESFGEFLSSYARRDN